MANEPTPPLFRRENLLLQGLLVLLTRQLYALYMLYRHTQVINAHVGPAQQIPAWLQALSIVSFVGATVLQLRYATDITQPPPEQLMIVFLVAILALLYWILLVRRGINLLSNAQPGDPRWVSLTITLVTSLLTLSPLYFQYVVNRELEARSRV
jgi:hypothetical protein